MDVDPEATPRALMPERPTLPALSEAAASCRGCDLWRDATQTVFGRGSARAAVLLVGEQPGDREDREGAPFVGPAGRVLDDALAAAGIDRRAVYVTNTVKHFRWQPKGKRRIHRRPSAEQIAACSPWLRAEVDLVRPDVIVCLGATAAQALLGRTFRVTTSRGTFLPSPVSEGLITATVHPSSILRAPDDETRNEEMAAFVEDLRKVAAHLAQASNARPSRASS